jgi:hypothetical protein
MIEIPVDESYAYDFLSILDVKRLKMQTPEAEDYFELCFNHIASQVGVIKNKKVMLSKEYLDLFNINLKTFDAVDKAKTDEVKASYVDKLNYERYLCKKALQEKFFENSQKEIKIGYR